MNIQKQKHIPERKCIGCQGRFPKNELIRVVRTPDGSVVLDKVGKSAGRGAYLCRSEACFTKAYRKGRIESALECKIPEELYDALKGELK